MEPDSSLIIRGFSAPLNAARNILALLPNIKDLQHADEIFQKHFNCLPAEEKLPVALELFDTYQTIELGVLEFLDKVWNDVTIERNYRPHFSSLDALKSAISFSTRVEPLQKRWLEVKRASSYRLREVEKNWGGSVETVIPEDYLPKKGAFGRNTVNALVNFGQHVSSPEEAKSLLLKAIQQRAPRAARKSPIGPADVSRAICMRSRQDAPIPNRLATTEPSSTQRTTRSQTLDTRRVTKRKRGNETELISPPSPPASSDTTTDDLHPEPQERTSTDPADHSVGINQNADQGRSTATIDPALTDEPQPSSPLSCEKCHPSIVNILSDYHTLKKWLGVDEGPQLGQSIYKSGLDKVCYQHLRLICAASYNLVNSKQTDELRERFCVCCKAHDEAALDNIRLAQRHWFRMDSRSPDDIADSLGTQAYLPRERVGGPILEFDRKELFNSLAKNSTAFDLFEKNGTINVPGIFDFMLSDDSEMASLVAEEFELYRHHARLVPAKGQKMGWIRHMIYSVTQQIMRADPMSWALTVAAREDCHYWMTSYPYYVKSQTPGESTGFTHIDINAYRCVQSGIGRGLVQSSVALTDEDDQNCTLLIPGFHRRIGEWVKRLEERGIKPGAGTTGVTDRNFTAEDCLDFGDLQPMPCKRGTLRLSRSELIHGATALATKRRDNIFPWLMGISYKNHRTLDIEQEEDWSHLATYNRDCVPPNNGPSGTSRRTRDFSDQVLPFERYLNPVDPICRALLGQEKWDSPAVYEQCRTILTGTPAQRSQLIDKIRSRLLRAGKLALDIIKDEEECFYLDRRSFFFCKREKVERQPDDSSADAAISDS